MTFLTYSQLSVLNVKWSGIHTGNGSLEEEHANPYYELIMVAEGPIYLQTEQEKLRLVTGECLLLRPWERHLAWRPLHEEAQFLWVQFAVSPGMNECGEDDLQAVLERNSRERIRQELRTEHGDEAERLVLPRRFLPGRKFELLRLFEQLNDEMRQTAGYFRHRSTLLLGQMLHSLAEETLERFREATGLPSSYELFRKLVSLLHAQFRRELDTARLEAALERKYEYLCHIFKTYAGTTISAYVHRLRIQQAQYMLHHTELDIQRIAEAVGFHDPYYFSRTFRRLVGVSPTGFRQNGYRAAAETNAPTLHEA